MRQLTSSGSKSDTASVGALGCPGPHIRQSDRRSSSIGLSSAYSACLEAQQLAARYRLLALPRHSGTDEMWDIRPLIRRHIVAT